MTDTKKREADTSTGKVVWHVTMSLDGFIAGADDAMDWVFEHHTEPSPVAEDAIRTTGAVLAGRRWYDLAISLSGNSRALAAGIRRGTEGIYGGAWTGPVFVLTNRPPSAPDDPAITFLSDGVENAVATSLAAANGKNVVLFGSTIPRQCVAAGLVDEILIHLAPVLLGDGIRLYGAPGAGRVSLNQIHVGRSGKVLDLRFRVAE